MGRQKYLQVSATAGDDENDEDNNENTIELTEVSQKYFEDDDEDDYASPGEFDDEAGSYDSDGRFNDYESAEHDVESETRYPVRTSGHARLPMDMIEEHLLWNVYNRWEEPNFLSLIVTTFVLMPTLLLWMYGAFEFVGKWWSIWILVLHLQIRLSISVWYIKCTSTVSFERRRSLRIYCSAATIFEVVMCGVVYPIICKSLTEIFFRDIDGTIVVEWKKEIHFMLAGVLMGWLVVILRCCIGIPCMTIRLMKHMHPERYREWRPTFWTPFGEEGTLNDKNRYRLQSTFRYLNVFVWGIHFICILSIISHFVAWPPGLALPENCDGLDSTECALPFPSFHHMKQDGSSNTGWRVDLKGMPPLRGGIPFRPTFLNEMDGFSTMGPILFYMKGLKEAYENGDKRHGLQGPDSISDSITRKSVTLLTDVDEQVLIPHSAEIDYLDPKNPLVMIFPAEPLKHNTHYAISVIAAKDENGRKLPRTKGMVNVMKATNSKTRTRFVNKVIPAIQVAAPWFSSRKEPESLQLLFDFVTASEESQLGPIRAARDVALEHVERWSWKDHVRVVSIDNNDCDAVDSSLVARTVHLSLDVPSFLRQESRYSFLDDEKIQQKKDISIGEAKAMFQIPCSLMHKTLNRSPGKSLRAIMETGHGLFGSREELNDHFYREMAHNNGYITMAMDWRGMSSFDLPVVIKVLIGNPNLFQAVRDNLIQGFANKLCLQHFSQNGMLDLDAFKFDGRRIPVKDRGKPTSVFYGISQGGILGGGYVSLAGKTNLIDRGILGVPGTPFAEVLTRSSDFVAYDKLLLLNLYNNRHVRILMAILQMAWDSTEASGLQARPVSEPIPRLLLQAGLGDPIVPTIAAESLARAMGASTLPGNPRTIFGVPVAPEASSESLGPNVTISEVMYEKEYDSLPIDNIYATGPNNVHWCVRVDRAMIEQVEEFINTGRVLDPCKTDQCRRKTSISC